MKSILTGHRCSTKPPLLGSTITLNCGLDAKVNSRIEAAEFGKLDFKIFSSHGLKLAILLNAVVVTLKILYS